MHKCQNCSQTFTQRCVLSLNFHFCIVHQNYSDDLRSHSVQCSLGSWDQSMMEAMMHYTPEGGIQHNIEFADGLGIVSTPIIGNPLYEHPSATTNDFIDVDLFSQPDGLKYYEESTQGLQHFFSPISSTLSEGSSSPSTSSEMMSITDYPFPNGTPSSRSSVSSSHVCWSHFPLIYLFTQICQRYPLHLLLYSHLALTLVQKSGRHGTSTTQWRFLASNKVWQKHRFTHGNKLKIC